uniref:TSC22 domain family protein 4 n=1 Tax=Pristiophorus japonicus TaxID=55135 RepID=UPI00398E81A8
MIGKKKSGFQITSVTSDYDGGSSAGPKETANGEAEAGAPSAAPLVNGGPGYGPGGNPLAPDRTTPPSEAAGEGATRGAARDPPEPPPSSAQEASLPGPAAVGKSPLKTACPLGGSCGSRFRVVKLDHGLGEPYRRGRWTCLDLYDKDLDGPALAKALDGAGRHVNSLDSHLELGGLAHKAVNQLRPKPHAPKSHGLPTPPPPGTPGNTLNMLLQAARTLAGPPRPSGHPPAASVPGVGAAATAPKETAVSKSDSSVLAATSREPLRQFVEQTASQPLSPNLSQHSSGEQGGIKKFSEPRSTSASPGPLVQDASPSRKARGSDGGAAGSLRFVSPMQTLAKSMLSVGTHQDGDDDSGSSSSMVAIDNKIEQAMGWSDVSQREAASVVSTSPPPSELEFVFFKVLPSKQEATA